MRIIVFLIALLIAGCTQKRYSSDPPVTVQSNGDQESGAQKPEQGRNQDRRDPHPLEKVMSKMRSEIATKKPEPGKEAVARLYTDAEIEKLAGKQVDTLKKEGVVDLDVVPNGESHPRSEVFKKMGIDENRLVKGSQARINMVAFLTWQASPSYDLSFMTATNDPANEEFPLLDPKRKVYGVRIHKHFHLGKAFH